MEQVSGAPAAEQDGGERWLPVPGYEGLYEVSDMGRVRSIRRGGAILANCTDYSGYPVVQLSRAGSRKPHTTHRLVCRAFHGEQPNPLHNEVAHLDGDRTNARADNLSWVSKVENHAHKRVHGTHQSGEKHPRAKLKQQDVAEIRTSTFTARDLAVRYGVSVHTISDIRRKRRWKTDAPVQP